MANYRPKSLNELGNLYDKSLEAENEIKKSSSKLEELKAPAEDAFSEDEPVDYKKVTPEQIAADEIASRVSDFAKTFGADNNGKAPAGIVTVQSKPRAPKRKPEASAESTNNKRVPVKKQSAPKLIRDSERTSLFDNYMKVMNDEDDYNFADSEEKTKRSKFRKKKADKKGNTEDVNNQDPIADQAQSAVNSVFAPDENAQVQNKTPAAKIEVKEEYSDPFSTDLQEKSDATSTSAGGNSAVKILLTAVLFVILLLSVTVGGIKAFTKLNSDAVAFGKSQLYSAQIDYPGTDISKGDLVFVENRQPMQGEMIAYRNTAGRFGFVTFESVLNSESMRATEDSEQLVVFTYEYRGAVTKTVPVIGSVFAICNAYFLPVMALMFLLIGLLILLIFFVSRGKSEQEEAEEKSEESSDSHEDTVVDYEEDVSYEQDASLYEQYYADDNEAENDANV
ncbi:MAG: hypothetical protein E7544_01195 [Ruminococcaceae bacterium]|nr:hypothetical protein [Oscillospiraceae bacterium]